MIHKAQTKCQSAYPWVCGSIPYNMVKNVSEYDEGDFAYLRSDAPKLIHGKSSIMDCLYLSTWKY